MSDDFETLQPGSTFGQYQVVGLLGRGGMGEVYEVVDELADHLALKLLSSEVMEVPGALERFQREARVMSEMDHPGIIKVLCVGETDGRHWIGMELMPGWDLGEQTVMTLGDYVRHHGGKLPQDEVLGILGRLLDALGHAHEMGLVHRDVKPANVLLGEDALKIADFGLVGAAGADWMETQVRNTVLDPDMEDTLIDSSGTGSRAHALMGTYAYMSPEQRKGLAVDHRSDLFALGLIGFQMLTGLDMPGMKRPSELGLGLDHKWDSWLMSALEENPADRFASARHMADALGFDQSGSVEEEKSADYAEGHEATFNAEARKRRLERERSRPQQENQPRHQDEDATRRELSDKTSSKNIVRWKGVEYGPFTVRQIDDMVASRQLSGAAQVNTAAGWILVQDFLQQVEKEREGEGFQPGKLTQPHVGASADTAQAEAVGAETFSEAVADEPVYENTSYTPQPRSSSRSGPPDPSRAPFAPQPKKRKWLLPLAAGLILVLIGGGVFALWKLIDSGGGEEEEVAKDDGEQGDPAAEKKEKEEREGRQEEAIKAAKGLAGKARAAANNAAAALNASRELVETAGFSKYEYFETKLAKGQAIVDEARAAASSAESASRKAKAYPSQAEEQKKIAETQNGIATAKKAALDKIRREIADKLKALAPPQSFLLQPHPEDLRAKSVRFHFAPPIFGKADPWYCEFLNDRSKQPNTWEKAGKGKVGLENMAWRLVVGNEGPGATAKSEIHYYFTAKAPVIEIKKSDWRKLPEILDLKAKFQGEQPFKDLLETHKDILTQEMNWGKEKDTSGNWNPRKFTLKELLSYQLKTENATDGEVGSVDHVFSVLGVIFGKKEPIGTTKSLQYLQKIREAAKIDKTPWADVNVETKTAFLEKFKGITHEYTTYAVGKDTKETRTLKPPRASANPVYTLSKKQIYDHYLGQLYDPFGINILVGKLLPDGKRISRPKFENEKGEYIKHEDLRQLFVGKTHPKKNGKGTIKEDPPILGFLEIRPNKKAEIVDEIKKHESANPDKPAIDRPKFHGERYGKLKNEFCAATIAVLDQLHALTSDKLFDELKGFTPPAAVSAPSAEERQSVKLKLDALRNILEKSNQVNNQGSKEKEYYLDTVENVRLKVLP